MSSLRDYRAQHIRALAEAGRGRLQIAAELGLSYESVARYAREYRINIKHGNARGGRPDKRGDAMAAMYTSGKTLQEIGDLYGITRERVRQILTRYAGLNGKHGGNSARSAAKKRRRAEQLEAECRAKNGCSRAQLQELRRIGREMVAAGAGRDQTPIGAFLRQRCNARSRGIVWVLSLWDWWTVWQSSGKWGERGRRADGYVMCRFRDDGPYDVGNVYIATLAHNSSLQANHPRRKSHPDHEKWLRGLRSSSEARQ